MEAGWGKLEYGGAKWNSEAPWWSQKGVCELFYGTFTPKLDDKARMFLPAKFREAMAPGCVATLGFDRTVAIYPRAAFEEINAQVSALPVTVAANRDFARMFRANAHEQLPDKQGRIALPLHLREYARLNKELVVNGAGKFLEVWDAAVWTEYRDSKQDGFSAMNAELMSGDVSFGLLG